MARVTGARHPLSGLSMAIKPVGDGCDEIVGRAGLGRQQNGLSFSSNAIAAPEPGQSGSQSYPARRSALDEAAQCNDVLGALGKIEEALLPGRVGSVFAHRAVRGKPERTHPGSSVSWHDARATSNGKWAKIFV
jgi:hypothetical protein